MTGDGFAALLTYLEPHASASGFTRGSLLFDIMHVSNPIALKLSNKSLHFFVGDQLFTDVWGANRAGIMSVLVKPIDKHEEIQIILKRRLEWIVLFFYKRRKH